MPGSSADVISQEANLKYIEYFIFICEYRIYYFII